MRMSSQARKTQCEFGAISAFTSGDSDAPIFARLGKGKARAYESGDDLSGLSERFGKLVYARAAELLRDGLSGDTSDAGFVRAVLDQVPEAASPYSVAESSCADGASGSGQGDMTYGPIIFVQNGENVQSRVCDIKPGDIAVMSNANFKGYRDASAVAQMVGIINQVEDTDELKVWQAVPPSNTHPAVSC